MNIQTKRTVRVEAESLDTPILVTVNTAAPRYLGIAYGKAVEAAKDAKDAAAGNAATYTYLTQVVTAVTDEAGEPITVDDNKPVLPLGEHVPDFLTNAIYQAVEAAMKATDPKLKRI